MAAASESNDEDSVRGVFEQGFLLHCQIEDDEAPSNSDAFQVFFLVLLFYIRG